MDRHSRLLLYALQYLPDTGVNHQISYTIQFCRLLVHDHQFRSILISH